MKQSDMTEPASTSEEKGGPRKSSRERKLTPKMLELKQQEIGEREGKFNKMYQKWKEQVRAARSKLKTECNDQDLSYMMDDVEDLETQVKETYECIRSNLAPSTEVRRKMDSCTAVTADLMGLLKVRMSELELEEFDANAENSRLCMILDKEYAQSIFGSSSCPSKSSAGSHHSRCSSEHSNISEKRAECAAQLAAKQAEIKMEEAIAVQRQELKRLENERDLQVIAARLKAYSEADPVEVSENHMGACSKVVDTPSRPNIEVKREQSNSEASLVQAIYDTAVLSRLPIPEPTVFTGDPLKFLEWSTSFKALIERRCSNPADRLYYLQKYIGGEVQSVLEGSFYRQDAEAYDQAWEALQARYGHPFAIRRAFKERLNNWPKIGPREPTRLRHFSDFLTVCDNAMPHIKGLQILNECEENQKMLQKLPDWVTSRWNRYVTKQLKQTQEYPSFKEFAQFVAQEAEIACNPVSSLHALKTPEDRPAKEIKQSKVNTFITNVTSSNKPSRDQRGYCRTENVLYDTHDVRDENEFPSTSNSTSCMYCDQNHSVQKCYILSNKPQEEKRKFVFDNNLCFGCLRRGHSSKDCQNKATCGKCKKNHPTSLHEERPGTEERPPQAVQVQENSSALSCSIDKENGGSTSMIVPVWISSYNNPERESLIYALLDTQSSNTFIDQGVSEKMDAEFEPVKLRLTTMMGKDSVVQSKKVCGLRVRGFSSQSFIDLPPVYTRDFIPLERSHIPTPATAQKWEHLNSIAQKIPDLMECEVGLLIGYDCSRALVPRQVVTGRDDEPYAIKTDLGWSVVGGSTSTAKSKEVTGFCHRTHVKELPLLTPATVIRALEADFRDTDSGGKNISQDDIQFTHLLGKGIHKNEAGHLEMPLPFKGQPQMPDNRRLALTRLKHLKGKFDKNPKFKTDYTKFMEGVFQDGDAEVVKSQPKPGRLWYIPHQGVYHPKKPDKIRVVFDCSAQYDGTALNDHLLSGPDLTNGLTGVLCRFRKNAVAITCDVEKMFHRFHVNKEDRDYLRFVWWKNGDTSTEPIDYRMKVHLFGATSSPGCANYGLKYLAAQCENKFPEAAKFIKRDFYVDDGLISVESAEKAIRLVKEAQAVCNKGRLHLHKFISNSREVLESIPEEERATGVQAVDLSSDELPDQTVLGVKWNVNNDSFSFEAVSDKKSPTRRGILSTVASVFDPLGFLAPFLLVGKKILQEMCRRGTGWDEPLPEGLRSQWEDWVSDLQHLPKLHIPRCFVPENMGKIQKIELHHFSDACCYGYGQCTYLRVVGESKVHCTLVIGKARVAPIKMVTIPRLELTAAVVSSAVSKLLKDELDFKVDQEYFWTDSQVVLGYINNEARRFHIFVANRVQRIRETTDPTMWHYIDTAQNPADQASRGLKISELIQSNWLTGPSFLWETEIIAPKSTPELLLGDPEIKATQVFYTETATEGNFCERFKRFSKWHTAVNVVARIQQLSNGSKRGINVEDRKKAGLTLIKLAQKEAFKEEMQLLSQGRLPLCHPLSSLDPIIQDGILRVGGRLQKASIPLDLKHPVILPKEGVITRLILSHCHERIQHQGRGQTLNELRANGYWVVGGSKVVATHIKQCITCRRMRRPTETQKMAELPINRVEPSPPFSYCGMDCFGPFYTKQGRKENKRYGLIFTCLSSRAVHVEMLDDLTTDAFINALRCFIAVRGTVREIRSDQGTNFVGAKNELVKTLKEMDKERLTAFLAEKQCDLVMNPPDASHMGGVWERQIRTVRSVLSWAISQSLGRLDDASLRTFLYEAMSIVNNRPLATDYINDPQGLTSLTPNHLLTMKTSVPLPPPGKFVREDLYVKKRWRRVQYLTEQFWNRWKKEYLANITIRQRWHSPKRNVKMGDIVIVKEEGVPRNEWKLGKVVRAFEDGDGLVRKAAIQLGNRKNNPLQKASVIERPIHKLVVLVENN